MNKKFEEAILTSLRLSNTSCRNVRDLVTTLRPIPDITLTEHDKKRKKQTSLIKTGGKKVTGFDRNKFMTVNRGTIVYKDQKYVTS